MNVLIIGGTGLISTAVTKRLVALGHSVTHYNRGQSKARFDQPVKVINGDRYNHAEFVKQMKALPGRFDVVIDMICYKPADAHSLVEAFAGRTDQVIFTSTVDVYARPADTYPLREGDARRPASEYGQNKVWCEDILTDANRRGDFPLTIIRPAYTTGEGATWLVSGFGKSWDAGPFIDRLLKGRTIISHGDGMSLWCVTHIDDAAVAFSGALKNPLAFGNAYNVTADEIVTWDQYIQQMALGMGAPEPRFVHIPTDLLMRISPEAAGGIAGNFKFNNVFDNSAAKADLGFRYTIPLVQTMKRLGEWYLKNVGRKNCEEETIYDKTVELWQQLTEQMTARAK